MLPLKRARTQSIEGLGSTTRANVEAKKELARRLLEGKGVEKNEGKAVSLLDDCVVLGDADAMLMLAKCCALGLGMERDAERAEALISESADNGNGEARELLKLISESKRAGIVLNGS